jgi:hypothetical protein
MVLLAAWQVVLTVPADLDDGAAESVADEVRVRLAEWVAVEAARLSAGHPGCGLGLEEG